MKKSDIKNCNRKKILMVVAGGTGGHIYPSLSLINKMSNYNFIIITDQRGGKYYENFFEKKSLNFKIFTHKVSSPSNKNIIQKIISLLQISISLIKSLFIILFKKPDVVIGFGGYPTIAPMISSKICSIPSIIHEQNAIIGRVNKLLSKISNILALSFVDTKKVENVKNIIFTGNPVRREFEEIGRVNYIKSISNKPFTILIYGGSLGASYFSKQLTSIICQLPEKIRKEIKIIQQVRVEDLKTVRNKYKTHKIEAEISTFFQNIYDKFETAHLIITRSGGSTVAEILASCKPAIFVPLPNSLDNHQYENAKFFETNNCGWIFDQINNSKSDFERLLKDIFKNKQKLSKASQKIRNLSQALSNLRKSKTPSDYLSDLISEMSNNPKKGINNLC